MAEIALGSVPLISLFQTCLQLYDYVITTKRFKSDLENLNLCFEYERAKLLALKSVFIDGRLQFYPERLVQDTLVCTHRTLGEVERLLSRHGKRSSTQIEARSSASGLKEVGAKMKKPLTTISWLGSDKARLKELLGILQTMNENMRSVVTPPERTAMDFRLRSSTISTGDPQTLEHIRAGYDEPYPEIGAAAELKLLTMQNQEEYPMTSLRTPVERFKCSTHSIEWSKLSLGKAARPHIGQVSTSQVVQLDKAYGFYSPTPTSPSFPVLVEWRPGFYGDYTASAHEERLDRLVKTLRSMHARSTSSSHLSNMSSPRYINFSILKCIGWIAPYDDFTRLGLIFAYPDKAPCPKPTSLRRRIESDRHERRTIPPLGARFDLAYGVAKTVADLVTIGWIHKGMRSENIAFFDDTMGITYFYLTGFTYARREDIPEDFSRPIDREAAWLLYRPPSFAKMEEMGNDGVPTQITRVCDIYALGIILIEIGLWWTIGSLKGDKSLEEFRGPGGVLSELVEGLSERMGDIYTSQVRKCLAIDSEEDEYDLIAGVLQNLGRCRA